MMYNKFKIVLAITFAGFQVLAQTTVPGGVINSGTWTQAGSPYTITGTIQINQLTIEPGVTVLLADDYDIIIQNSLTASGTYEDSIIFNSAPGNSNGWGGLQYLNTPVGNELEYVRVEGGNAQGILVSGCDLVINNCTVTNSGGHGISASGATLSGMNCRITGNGSNGILTNDSETDWINCIIAANTQQGIFISSATDSLNLINSVVADNEGTGIYILNGKLRVGNSIVYGNDSQITNSGGNIQVTYSDVQGAVVFPGTGNINNEPDFLNSQSYQLSANSYCIDAGDPDPLYNDMYLPPSQNTIRNDMGAYGGPGAGAWFNPLYVHPHFLDFGYVLRDSTADAQISVKNYTDTVLTISDITIAGYSQDNFAADTSNFSLAVNESLTVTISFTPDNSDSASAIMHLLSDQGTDSVSLAGRGVVPGITILTNNLDLGQVILGDSVIQMLRIYNVGLYNLELTNLFTNKSIFRVTPQNLIIPPNSDEEVEIHFKPDTVGTFKDTLTILNNDPDPGDNPYHVVLNGSATGSIIFSAIDDINFGQVEVTGDSVIIFSLENRGNDDLIIDTMRIEGSGANKFVIDENFPVTISPAEDSMEFELYYIPDERVSDNAILKIPHNDQVADTIRITLSGRGIGPEFFTGIDSLEFRRVALDSSKTRAVTVYNRGESGLILSTVRLSDGNKEAFRIITDVHKAITVAPDDSVKITVSFTPRLVGYAWTDLEFTSNDIIYPDKKIKLTGLCSVPEIQFTDEQLDFGRIAMGTDSTRFFRIKNTGMATLYIGKDSLSILASDTSAFSFNFTNNLRLAPGDSSGLIPVTFAPTDTINYVDTLIVFSNDRDKSPFSLPLLGSAYDSSKPVIQVLPGATLNFGDIIVTNEKDSSVVISNIGQKNLIISAITQLQGQDKSAFSLNHSAVPIELLPTQKDTILITFKSAKPFGTKKTQIQIESNDATSDSIYTINIEAACMMDTSSARITLVPMTEKPVMGVKDTLEFRLENTIVPVENAIFHLRKGGAETYGSQSMINKSGDIWQAVIPAESITERGLEYVVSAEHGGRTNYYPAGGLNTPVSLTVSIPYLAFQEMTRKNFYQMISIPCDTYGKSLGDLFSDNLGEYDNTKYRIFDWEAGAGEYVELTAMTRSLPPGNALWLITLQQTALDITDGESTPTNKDFELILYQGWNMIGDPFAFSVSWQKVDSLLTLHYYDGQGWVYADKLEPFKGYAVHVKNDTIIKIPPVEDSPSQKIAAKDDAFADSWKIRISAEKGIYHDRYNFVGVVKPGKRRNVYEPPSPKNALSLYCIPENKPAEKLSACYQPQGMDGYSFKIQLRSNFTGKSNLAFTTENFPENFDWTVVSPELKIKYPKGDIETDNKEHLFIIFVGTENYLDENLQAYREVPRTYNLAQNYPNPFNPSTTIVYQVPKVSRVNLSIYDLLGRRVINLEKDKLREAGYYTIRWDGTNHWGAQVASGLYFLTMQAGNYHKVIKMILQK